MEHKHEDQNKEAKLISKPWCPYCRTSLRQDFDAGRHATCACPRCRVSVKPHYPSVREEAESWRQDVLVLLKVQDPTSGLCDRILDGFRRELWRKLPGRKGDPLETFDAFCRDPKGLATDPAEVAAFFGKLNQQERALKLALVPRSRQGQKTSRHDGEKLVEEPSSSTSRHDGEKSSGVSGRSTDNLISNGTNGTFKVSKCRTPRTDTRVRTIRNGHPAIAKAWEKGLLFKLQAVELARMAREPPAAMQELLRRLEVAPDDPSQKVKDSIQESVRELLGDGTKRVREDCRTLLKKLKSLKGPFPHGAPGVLAEVVFQLWGGQEPDLALLERRLNLAERVEVLRKQAGERLEGEVALIDIPSAQEDELAYEEELVAKAEAELRRTGTSR